MKIFNVKTAIAVVCVVAAGFGGVKAYNAANQSEADLLLAENVEAISACESVGWWNNDGCCVNNGKGAYFCKTEDFWHFDDCKR